jgi:hypothetical protein
LRSDLLAENVAMAASTRRSRPASITFVSEWVSMSISRPCRSIHHV